MKANRTLKSTGKPAGTIKVCFAVSADTITKTVAEMRGNKLTKASVKAKIVLNFYGDGIQYYDDWDEKNGWAYEDNDIMLYAHVMAKRLFPDFFVGVDIPLPF